MSEEVPGLKTLHHNLSVSVSLTMKRGLPSGPLPCIKKNVSNIASNGWP